MEVFDSLRHHTLLSVRLVETRLEILVSPPKHGTGFV
jgi:hypothetical protein